GGQHLPLRDVPAHPGRHPPGGGAQEGRRMMKTARTRLSRRALLQGSLAAGAGLAVGFRLPLSGLDRALAQGAAAFAPNQWPKIDRDGVVTITNSVPES